MQKAKEYENQKALTGGFLISLLISSNRLVLQASLVSLISPPWRSSRQASMSNTLEPSI